MAANNILLIGILGVVVVGGIWCFTAGPCQGKSVADAFDSAIRTAEGQAQYLADNGLGGIAKEATQLFNNSGTGLGRGNPGTPEQAQEAARQLEVQKTTIGNTGTFLQPTKTITPKVLPVLPETGKQSSGCTGSGFHFDPTLGFVDSGGCKASSFARANLSMTQQTVTGGRMSYN